MHKVLKLGVALLSSRVVWRGNMMGGIEGNDLVMREDI